METKQCLRCKQDLPVEQFAKARSRPDGYDAYCRVCNAQRRRLAKLEPMSLTPEAVRNFMKNVRITESGCWEWTASVFPNGYGRFKHGTIQYAHRFSYYIFNGALCDGMEVCHSCDNPKCVNPAHLWQGTKSENLRDAAMKGRTNTVQLTPDDVRRIRNMHNLKYAISDIANHFGVTTTIIYNIVNRRTWDYIVDEQEVNIDANS